MRIVTGNATLNHQLTQYAEDFQILLSSHNKLKRRHEGLQAAHSKLINAADVLSIFASSENDLCLVINSDGVVVLACDNARTWLKLDLNRKSFFHEFLAPVHLAHLNLILKRIKNDTESTFDKTRFVLHPAGDLAKAKLHEVMCLIVPDEKFTYAYLVMRNLSELASENTISSLPYLFANKFHRGLVILDKGGVIFALDPGFLNTTGFLAEDLRGKKFDTIRSANNCCVFKEDFWLTLHRKGQWSGKTLIRLKDGKLTLYWLSAIAIKNALKRTCSYVFILADINQRIGAELAMLNAVCQDALTGLPQLSQFREQVDESISRAWLDGEDATLMYLKLSRLQWYQDMDGVEGAEEIVLVKSRRLQKLIKGSDLLSRIGFDEFAILIIGPCTTA